MSLRVIWQYMDRSIYSHMTIYEPVRHQKNIIWTSETSAHIIFFGDGPVHILPYDPQCHELFAIYPRMTISRSVIE
jgi:hypothetical protein